MNNRHINISVRTADDSWQMLRTNLRTQPISLQSAGESELTLNESQLAELQTGLTNEVTRLSELGWFNGPSQIRLSHHKSNQEIAEGENSLLSVVELNYEDGSPNDLLLQGWLSLIGVSSPTQDNEGE
jgi:hypothetical protein